MRLLSTTISLRILVKTFQTLTWYLFIAAEKGMLRTCVTVTGNRNRNSELKFFTYDYEKRCHDNADANLFFVSLYKYLNVYLKNNGGTEIFEFMQDTFNAEINNYPANSTTRSNPCIFIRNVSTFKVFTT